MTSYKRKILGKSARAEGGVSLLELMIVVVIVAILAGIGLPAYQQYSRQSKRADAHSALLRIATLQEKFFSNNNQYATSTTTLGYAAHPAASTEGYWAISVTAVGPAAYTLSAATAPNYLDPDCSAITLNSAGLKNPPDCW